MTVQSVILYSRESELQVRVNDTNTYDVVDELKALHCKSELWSMSIWTRFLSTMVEGNTCLESHLEKCIRYMDTLCMTWTTKLTDDFAITGELHLLPPSYKDRV